MPQSKGGSEASSRVFPFKDDQEDLRSQLRDLREADFQIRTFDGLRISVHSSILAMASPVLKNIMYRLSKHRRSERVIQNLGVPFPSCIHYLVVIAVTVGVEFTTGNSVFQKMDLQGIEEAAGVCLGAVAFAAVFASEPVSI